MFIESIKNHKVIIAIVLLYAFFTSLIFYWVDIPVTEASNKATIFEHIYRSFGAFVTPVMFYFLTLVLRVMIIDRPKRLVKTLWYNFINEWMRPPFLFKGLVVVLSLQLFILFFSPMKTLIPVLNPYGEWDFFFYELDKMIHFGMDPWTITHTIFSLPIFTAIINFLYQFWFFALYSIFILMSFICNDNNLRQQYLISFFLIWIINGTIFAVAFSSIGPCYYNVFFALYDDPYKELIARLNDIDQNHYALWALNVQDLLWQSYKNQSYFIGSGISAMPSLHVSIALLNTLVAYRTKKIYGHIMLAFFFIILIGSVHLGWHYAVDGYMSIISTLIIWGVVSWGVKKTMPKEEQKISPPQ